jgi:hypothetical protein
MPSHVRRTLIQEGDGRARPAGGRALTVAASAQRALAAAQKEGHLERPRPVGRGRWRLVPPKKKEYYAQVPSIHLSSSPVTWTSYRLGSSSAPHLKAQESIKTALLEFGYFLPCPVR